MNEKIHDAQGSGYEIHSALLALVKKVEHISINSWKKGQDRL